MLVRSVMLKPCSERVGAVALGETPAGATMPGSTASTLDVRMLELVVAVPVVEAE